MASKELLHGTLDVLILQVLAEEPRHGYAIGQRILALSRDVLGIEHGSLYPALYRMERRGWLKASWGVSEQNRRAKVYSLTASGRRELERGKSEWQRFAKAVAWVLSSGREAAS